MNLSLAGKYAWVGGAGAGIGRATAVELALLGASVTVVSRTESALLHTLSLLDTSQGQQHRHICVDLLQRDQLQAALAALLADHPLHILVNNSGGPPGGPIVGATVEAFEQAWYNHLIANQLLAQAALPGMKAAGFGRIVNIISTSVKEPLDGLGVSNSTRWAVAGWAKTWANEVGQFGITVNNVLPGYTQTGRLDEIIGKRVDASGAERAAVTAQMTAHVPARRFAQPEEVAAAVAFLTTPAAAYINGINLPVDGGRTRSL